MTSKGLNLTLGALILGIPAYFLLIRRSSTSCPPLRGAEHCKYPLDDSHSHTFKLSNSRTIGYADYGDPQGRVVLYQHGLPGSRIEAARYHHLGKELGIRVIAVERPGYGLSSPARGYGDETVKSWADDVEELVDGMGIKEYAVMGVSGGGPYALSLAHHLPASAVKALCIVCGIGPQDIGMHGAGWPAWLGFTCGWRYAPYLETFLRWFFQRDAATSLSLSDEERLRILLSPDRLSGMSDADRAFFSDEDEMRVYVATLNETFRQGYDGTCKDGFKMCMDWGFAIEDLRKDLPVVLWYGSEDRNVPPGHGREIAKQLRTDSERSVDEVSEKGELEWSERVRLRMLDDSHASISMRDKRGYLVDLMKGWNADSREQE